MEIFKEIPSYEGLYSVSNKGTVISHNYNHTGKSKELKQPLASSGYCRVVLCKNNIKRSYMTHQLIAMAFLNHTPNKSRGIVVDHIDNNKMNNALENLQVVDIRTNSCKEIDKTKTGTSFLGVIKVRESRFRARISIKGKCTHLGYFKTAQEASNAYLLKLSEL